MMENKILEKSFDFISKIVKEYANEKKLPINITVSNEDYPIYKLEFKPGKCLPLEFNITLSMLWGSANGRNTAAIISSGFMKYSSEIEISSERILREAMMEILEKSEAIYYEYLNQMLNC